MQHGLSRGSGLQSWAWNFRQQKCRKSRKLKKSCALVPVADAQKHLHKTETGAMNAAAIKFVYSPLLLHVESFS